MDPIILNFPERFETERLVISIYKSGDGEAFFYLLQKNTQHLQEEIRETQKIKSVEDGELYVQEKRAEWLSGKRMVPKILSRSSGRMIGQLWLEPRWDKSIIEIGYFLEEESQGKGYVTESVERVIEIAFNDLKVNKLEIHTKTTNQKSVAIAERCGFIQEAHLRERSRTNRGELVDLLIYGLLRREYGGVLGSTS